MPASAGDTFGCGGPGTSSTTTRAGPAREAVDAEREHAHACREKRYDSNFMPHHPRDASRARSRSSSTCVVSRGHSSL